MTTRDRTTTLRAASVAIAEAEAAWRAACRAEDDVLWRYDVHCATLREVQDANRETRAAWEAYADALRAGKAALVAPVNE
ncbi:MAG TPA: hypothetical protein VD931_03715 [Baekduia sp.]|nr:hypothetical protein [Baekduia sp.]